MVGSADGWKMAILGAAIVLLRRPAARVSVGFWMGRRWFGIQVLSEDQTQRPEHERDTAYMFMIFGLCFVAGGLWKVLAGILANR
jgi:hypothetical protein